MASRFGAALMAALVACALAGCMGPPILVTEGVPPGTAEEPLAAADLQCGDNDLAFVYDERGSTCDTYEAHVRGGARVCVTACDPPRRFSEAVALLARTCRAFCAEKGCRGGVYDAPSTCLGGAQCLTYRCPAGCPLLDYCYPEDRRRWNCRCVEL